MPLELKRSVAVLDGICEIGDAECLLTWLQANPDAKVDVTSCDHLHTAILQVLLAARPTIIGAEASANLRPGFRPCSSPLRALSSDLRLEKDGAR